MELPASLDRLELGPPQKLVAEYVWLGESGEFRSKSRTLEDALEITDISQLPLWSFDGSSTKQAATRDSEIFLKPCAFFKDPFRRGGCLLVLCECYGASPKLTPLPTNTRYQAAQIMEQAHAAQPWFSFLQQYILMNPGLRERHPFGWPDNGFPGPQGPYYCGVGVGTVYGRRVSEAHYRACLYAGVTIGAANSSQAPGQWEYSIGPCGGMRTGDVLCMSRYILTRVCEDFRVAVSFDPKPVPGDWSGSGCLTTFSTAKMRAPGGFTEVVSAIEKLGKNHSNHLPFYGVGNERRLTGPGETSPIHKFTYGVSHRAASVRIPKKVKMNQCGYFEDRRPGANCDPYWVMMKIAQTTILD